MTSKAALALALLEGRVLNIKNGFELFGITNIPREISRMIEKPFGVQVSRIKKEGKSRYGQPVYWYNYRLNRTSYNEEGIKKMAEYVKKYISITPKTEKESRLLTQASLFINTFL